MHSWLLGSRMLPVSVTAHRLSPEHRQRILQHRLERLQELRSRRAVDDAVIARHGQPEPPPHRELAFVRHRLLHDPPDGQDPRLRRVDQRRELIDVEHAKVGNGERAPRVFLGREPALACPRGEVVRFGRDLA